MSILYISVATMRPFYYTYNKGNGGMKMDKKNADEIYFLKRLFSKTDQSKHSYQAIEPTEATNVLSNYYKAFIQHYPGTIILFALDGTIITSNKEFKAN